MQISLSDHFTYQKLLRFVAPSILMMIITSIYSIVDGFFVSNFVGKHSFAALNLIFPVIMALAAVGFMIGTGGSALIAKTLGEGKPKEANEIFSMLVIVLAAGGAILSGVCIVFLRPISFAVGATGLTIDDCVLYGRVLQQSSHKTVFAKAPEMGKIWRDFGHAFSFASSSSRGMYPSPSYLIWMCCTRFPLDLSGAST